MKRKLCERTRKIRYDDAIDAGEQQRRLQAEGVPLQRLYFCSFCKSWHLTSDRVDVKLTEAELDIVLAALAASLVAGAQALGYRIGRRFPMREAVA